MSFETERFCTKQSAKELFETKIAEVERTCEPPTNSLHIATEPQASSDTSAKGLFEKKYV